MGPQQRLGQAGAVGQAVDVPAGDAQHPAEVGHVGGAGHRVVVGQVDAPAHQVLVAGREESLLGGQLIGGGRQLVELVIGELGQRRAIQERLAVARAPLVEDDHVPSGREGPEAVVEAEADPLEGVTAGAALQVQQRRRRQRWSRRMEHAHVEADLQGVGPSSVLGDHEVTAADLVARRRVETALRILESGRRGGPARARGAGGGRGRRRGGGGRRRRARGPRGRRAGAFSFVVDIRASGHRHAEGQQRQPRRRPPSVVVAVVAAESASGHGCASALASPLPSDGGRRGPEWLTGPGFGAAPPSPGPTLVERIASGMGPGSDRWASAGSRGGSAGSPSGTDGRASPARPASPVPPAGRATGSVGR